MPTLAAIAWSFLILGTQDKLQPPDKADQSRLRNEIQRLFKDDYRKNDAGALARRLLEEEAKAENDPGSRFAFLMEARDVAVKGSLFDLAFEAIDRLDGTFDLSKGAEGAREMKAAVLDKARRTARTPEAARFVAGSYLSLAREALASGYLEDADDAARQAATAARRARSRAIAELASEIRKDIGEIKRDKEAVDGLDRKAPIDIGNHAMNLKAGRYVCFVEGDWEKGLEYLLWSGQAGLKSAAELEVKKPDAPDAFLRAAEAWLDAARSESSSLNKRRYALRARHWLEKALGEATGVTRLKIEEALKETSTLAASAGALLALTEDLVGWWKLDERSGPEILDSSGNRRHGRQAGNPKREKGISGGALRLNGRPDAVAFGSEPFNVFPLTLAAWIRTTTTGASLGILNKYRAGSLNGYAVHIHGGRVLCSIFRGSFEHCIRNVDGGAINDGKWHHVAFVVDAKEGQVYVDGQLRQRTAWKGTAGPVSTGEPLRIGMYPGTSRGNLHFEGLIDDVRLYNRPLTKDELLILMESR